MENSVITSLNKENIDKVCRTCLKIEENMESIFEISLDHQENLNFVEILKMMTSIDASKTDGGPSKICQSCLNKTKEAYQFRMQCIEADKNINKFTIKDEPINDISEINDDCADSDEQVNSKKELLKHSPRPRKFKCNVCCKHFHTPYNLKRHSSVHKKVVESVLERENIPTVDITTKKGFRIKKNQCGKCHIQLYNKASYNRHLITHSDTYTRSKIEWDESHFFICVICSSQFKEHSALLSHMRDHKDPQDDKPIICKICFQSFTSVTNIIKHSNNHEENSTHICVICTRKYGFGEDFIEHVIHHEQEGMFRCDHCAKSFSKLGKLKRHIVSHSSSNPHLCPECGKSFKEPDYLRRHLVIHKGVKSHKCPICPFTFFYRGGLTSHMKTHSGRKPFICNVCGSSFSREDSLRTHLIKHSGEVKKPHICDVCGKAFVAPFNLRTHMRIHTGEKPFSCEFCTRSYSQKNDLVKHIRLHVGENTYQCNQCNSAFRLLAELKNHRIVHFQENVQKLVDNSK